MYLETQDRRLSALSLFEHANMSLKFEIGK